MSRPVLCPACVGGALAFLAAALACLAACASWQPASTPVPTAPAAAAMPTNPPAAATPTASAARPIPTASATSAHLSTPTASATPVPSATRRPTSATRFPPLPPPGTAVPSSDGGFLVYAEQGEGHEQPIRLVQGTATRVLAHGNGFQLSDDGRSIGFTRGFPEELWIAETVGLNASLVYTAPMGNPLIHSATWSPDRSTIALRLSAPASPASHDAGELWGLDVATGDVRRLVDRGGHRHEFSPDGRWLALASPFATLASHGSVARLDLASETQELLFDFVEVADLAWAHDSSGFVVALSKGSGLWTETETWWVPTGGPPEKLGRLPDAWDVHWQPGGGRMVYRKGEPGGVSRLYLAGRDGSDEQLIPDSEEMSLMFQQWRGYPAWSPDGRWLLTMREDGSHYLVDVETLAIYPLDVEQVYGWPGIDEYLVAAVPDGRLEDYWQGEAMPVDVYRCAPLGACAWLGAVPRWAQVGYGRP